MLNKTAFANGAKHRLRRFNRAAICISSMPETLRNALYAFFTYLPQQMFSRNPFVAADEKYGDCQA